MYPLLNAVEQQVRNRAAEMAMDHVDPRAAELDATGHCPGPFVLLLCTQISEDVEGSAPTLMHMALRLEEVARCSAAAAAIAGAHGVGQFIARHRKLTDLRGHDPEMTYAIVFAATGLTANTTDDGVILQGAIPVVPAAAYATAFIVVCERGDAAGVFIISADVEGVTVGQEQAIMGLLGSGTTSLHCDGVELTRAGWVGDTKLAALARAATRIAHAAQAIGIAEAGLDAALEHAASKPGEKPQSVQWMLADIATETEAARVSLWDAAIALGSGKGYQGAAMCRLLAAEAAVGSSRRALQIVGEGGMLRSSVLERLYRDAKVMEILGETTEVQLGVIADALLPTLSH